MIVSHGRLPRSSPPATTKSMPPPTRLARMLALSWLVDELIDQGMLSSYSEAAAQLGITRARMSQIARLRFLAPAIQELIASGGHSLTERRLRAVTTPQSWTKQLELLRGSYSTNSIPEVDLR